MAFESAERAANARVWTCFLAICSPWTVRKTTSAYDYCDNSRREPKGSRSHRYALDVAVEEEMQLLELKIHFFETLARYFEEEQTRASSGAHREYSEIEQVMISRCASIADAMIEDLGRRLETLKMSRFADFDVNANPRKRPQGLQETPNV